MSEDQRGLDPIFQLGLAVLVALGVVVAIVFLFAPGQFVAVDEPVARSYADYVWLREETVTVTATGSGSGSTDRELSGYVYAVHLDFSTGISTTTDVTVSQASPALTLLQLTNYYTDTWFYPVTAQHLYSGTETATYERFLAVDALDIAVGDTISGSVALTATVYWGQ